MAQSGKLNALIISGDDVPSHEWRITQEEYRTMLLDTGKFDVRISEDINILESSKALNKYDVVFLVNANTSREPLSDQGKANLEYFINNGKGMVVCHMASGAFNGWMEFKKMCGVYWDPSHGSGHTPGCNPFEVIIKDKDNPISKGISNFETVDELYSALIPAGLEFDVVASGIGSFKGCEGKEQPLALTINYGKGRIFHQCFGHDKKALSEPNIRTLIIRGTEWAATGKCSE